VRIVKASTVADFAIAGQLIQEYRDYLVAEGIFECAAGNFDTEIQNPSRTYPSAQGGVYLAFDGDRPTGCAALEEQTPGIGEVRRLFVRADFRGRGLGRELIAFVVEDARSLGYRVIRLDTFRRIPYAQNIYLGLGFQEIPPYNELPRDKVIFLEQSL